MSISARKSKVSVKDFSPGFSSSLRPGEMSNLFPDILAGRSFKRLVESIVTARRRDKQVIFMLGGHVVKTGVSPLLIDLLEADVITGVAMNGAAAIHDLEIAMWGETSEDVEEALADGVFGMTSETASFMNSAIEDAFKGTQGMGEALGKALTSARAPFGKKSLIACCYRKDVPLTVHVAIGTDVTHQHPDASGQAIGETSMRDFRLFVSLIEKIRHGVVLNVGSAVILPEVFLKALAIVRNRGTSFWPLTTANLDAIQHYRPVKNVVERPTGIGKGSVGITLTGHHELMIPLLTASILHRLKRP
ncbi:MAG: hypothetical protein AMJ46_01545 [Latescibacteria bacterium DG_63]|nr:MAG: hypothetical protein AMJ46_01545 [Latescibacteria bacterium DG_63]